MKLKLVTVLIITLVDLVVTLLEKGYCINGIYHERDILVRGVFKRPYNLAMHVQQDNLYFSFTANDDEEVPIFKSAMLNIETKLWKVLDLEDGFAHSPYDNTTVFLGSSNGIYKYQGGDIKFYAMRGIDIYYLYYNRDVDTLFYTAYPFMSLRWIYLKDGGHGYEPELAGHQVYQYKIDGKHESKYRYWRTETQIWGYSKFGKTKIYDSYNDAEMIFANLAVNEDNNKVYSSLDNHIFEIDLNRLVNQSVYIFSHTDLIYGFQFDKSGRFIIATEFEIVRLIPNYIIKC